MLDIVMHPIRLIIDIIIENTGYIFKIGGADCRYKSKLS